MALPMNESQAGYVSAEEVEKRVREIVDSDEGNKIRERVLAKRDEALAAMSDDGSCRVALDKFFESWKT